EKLLQDRLKMFVGGGCNGLLQVSSLEGREACITKLLEPSIIRVQQEIAGLRRAGQDTREAEQRFAALHTRGLLNPVVRAVLDATCQSFKPDVIILDTKTSLFQIDFNSQADLLKMNDFLIQHRSRGRTILCTHHAGKSGEQRGRTDNDDISDL